MSPPARRGLNAAIAAAILPDRADTLLLRACLLDAGPARAAWDAWCGAVGDPKAALETETRGLKGLLPLVDAAARAHGFPGPDGLGIYLKASALREELRTGLIAAILARVLDALEADRIPFTLLGGLVAAHTVYAAPALRHCHAIELLVSGQDRAPAAAALARAGFTPLDLARTAFRHTDGLALNLLRDIAFHPHHQVLDGGVVRRAAPLDLGGRATSCACATDRLMMALSRAASTRERANLRWADDAFLTLPVVDWPVFLAETVTRRLALPFSLLCRYLADALGGYIPREVLAALDVEAGRAGRLDREAAVDGAFTGLGAARRALGAPGIDVGAWLEIVRYLVLPSSTCLSWTYGPANIVLGAIQRAHRPVRYVTGAVRRRWAGPIARRIR